MSAIVALLGDGFLAEAMMSIGSVDFQQELLELLGRHAIDYDPRYVFD